MKSYLAAYAISTLVMIGLDMLWLGLIAKRVYQAGIGHLVNSRPRVPVAIVFYTLFSLGLVAFAVAPQSGGSSWIGTLAAAAGGKVALDWVSSV